jgi:ribonuclease BN (tRNA processing enzyme)/UTP-glucose-1-phosphate uridylyltransferase
VTWVQESSNMTGRKSPKSKAVRYALVPVAGKGTRLLPVTGVIPKELIPLGNKPMVQYVFERILHAGIQEVVVVISPWKKELKKYLKQEFSKKITLRFVTQREPFGLADAISLCRRVIGHNPFLLCMPDGFHWGDQDFITRQMQVFKMTGKTTLSIYPVAAHRAYLYGNCGKIRGFFSTEGHFIIEDLGDKRSGTFEIGGEQFAYRGTGITICAGEVFDYIERYRSVHGNGELDDVPVFQMLLKDKGLVAEAFRGDYIDVGNQEGLLYAQHFLWENMQKDMHSLFMSYPAEEKEGRFEMIVLGSGTAVPHAIRFGPGYALRIDERYIFFDPSAGTVHRAVRHGMDMRTLSHIFFTHLHPDHTGDLVPLLFALKNPDIDPSIFLEIIGLPGFRDFFYQLKQVYGKWIEPPPERAQIQDITRYPLHQKGWNIQWEPLSHIVESIGFRVTHESTGKVWAYSGDTDYCEGIIRLVRQADVAVLECSFPDQFKAPGHLTPSLAGRIAREGKVQHLVLSHFYPRCDGEDIISQCRSVYKGPLTVAHDYLRMRI